MCVCGVCCLLWNPKTTNAKQIKITWRNQEHSNGVFHFSLSRKNFIRLLFFASTWNELWFFYSWPRFFLSKGNRATNLSINIMIQFSHPKHSNGFAQINIVSEDHLIQTQNQCCRSNGFCSLFFSHFLSLWCTKIKIDFNELHSVTHTWAIQILRQVSCLLMLQWWRSMESFLCHTVLWKLKFDMKFSASVKRNTPDKWLHISQFANNESAVIRSSEKIVCYLKSTVYFNQKNICVRNPSF